MHDPRSYGIEIGQEVMTSRGVSPIVYIGGGLVITENGDHIDFATVVSDQEAERRVEALKRFIERPNDLDRHDPVAFMWVLGGSIAVLISLYIVLIEL